MRFGIGKHEPNDHHAHPDAGDLRAAYERGRREERAHHRRHPLLGVAVGLAALVGGATLVMSALHGSFAGGGASLDQGLSAAVQKGGPGLKDVAQDIKGQVQAAPRKGG